MAVDWEYTFPSNHEKLLAYLVEEFNFLKETVERAEDAVLEKPQSIHRIYHLACVLWQSEESYDLSDLFQEQLYNALLDWTLNASCNTQKCKPVKLAMDRLLCSMCTMRPHFYDKLLLKIGILLPDLESDGISSTKPASVQDLELVNVTENMLKSLSVISLSYVPTLINSKFLSKLILIVLDFISKSIETLKKSSYLPTVEWLDGENIEGRRAQVEPKPCSTSDPSDPSEINIDLVSEILNFFAELCWQNATRQWLCSEEQLILWRCLLSYLCVEMPQQYRCDRTDRPSFQSYRKFEEAAINFFSKLSNGCFKTQEKFAEVFYEVMNTAIENGSSPLGISRFTRRILLEFISSPGYMYVSIETDLARGMNKIIPADLESLMPPPAFPLSKRHQLLYVNIDRTCEDILKAVTADGCEISPAIKFDEIMQDTCVPSTKTQSADNSPSRKRSQKMKDTDNQQTKKTKAHNLCESNKNGFKLMVWEQKTNRYVSIDGHLRISEILKQFFPTGEELEMPVLKFLLLNDEKTNEGKHLKPHLLSPSPGILKFIELEGYQKLALYIEARPIKSTYNSSWSYIPMSTLLTFGFFLRFPGYRNNGVVCQLIKFLLGINSYSLTPCGVINEIRSLVNHENRYTDIHSSLSSIPFGTLRHSILTNHDNTVRADLSSADMINFILMFLAVYSEKSTNMDIVLIPEHSVYQKAIQHCYLAKLKTGGSASATYWPKGTGYSSSNDVYFSSSRKDEEFIVELLSVLASLMNPHPEFHSREYMKHKDDISNMRFVHSLSPLAVRIIKKSCLLPLIFHYLEIFSVFEASNHIPLYRTLMLMIRIMITNVQFVEMIITPYTKNIENPGTSAAEQSVITVIKLMIKEINEYRRMSSKYEDRYASLSRELKNGSTRPIAPRASTTENEVTRNPEDDLYRDIFDTLDIIESITRNLPAIKFPEPKSTALFLNPEPHSSIAKTESTSSTGTQSSESERQKDSYVSLLKRLQFGQYEMLTEQEKDCPKFNVAYAFQKTLQTTMVTIPSRMKRLSRELSNLSSSLPMSKESAIFVRHDESRIDVIKALITGPSGTPYMNGCFEFDISCPENYPSSPIYVKFVTTGRNSVRFNPNLYPCGKVCLSVLNTWMGGAGEDWNPQTSTILQVLVSIQGMIFISEPYFNEPGYEVSRGDAHGKAASQTYNHKLMPATVKWAMTQQLISPNPCFEEVIKKHFWLKKEEIKQQVNQWIEETSGDIKEELKSEAEKLFKKLDELQQPTD